MQLDWVNVVPLVKCVRCKQDKEREAFATQKARPAGLSSWCKKCHQDWRRERYNSDEAFRARVRAENKRSADWLKKHQGQRRPVRFVSGEEKAARSSALRDGRGRVYFIRAGCHIKIGFSENNVGERMSHLQTAHYETLELLGVEYASRSREHEVHCLFRAFHVRGEWFKECPELHSYISDHTSSEAILPPAYSRGTSPRRRSRASGNKARRAKERIQ